MLFRSFTVSGNLTVKASDFTVDYLVVAGGGGGGGNQGSWGSGGGGAGGYRTSFPGGTKLISDKKNNNLQMKNLIEFLGFNE